MAEAAKLGVMEMVKLTGFDAASFDGGRLRAKRQEQRLSREALAELAGVHENSIKNAELGRYVPKLETINKLAMGLAIPVADLLIAQEEGGPHAS